MKKSCINCIHCKLLIPRNGAWRYRDNSSNEHIMECPIYNKLSGHSYSYSLLPCKKFERAGLETLDEILGV